MGIVRHDSVPGMSRVVVHQGVLYFTGHGARPEFVTPREQTAAVLQRLEELLVRFGSDKEHVLNALIFVKDISAYPEVSEVWQSWIPAEHAPACTLVEARISQESAWVEITLTAAVRGYAEAPSAGQEG